MEPCEEAQDCHSYSLNTKFIKTKKHEEALLQMCTATRMSMWLGAS